MSSEPSHFFAVEDLPADFIRPGTERRSIRLGEVQFMFISFDRPTVSPPHDHTWDSIIYVDRGEFDVTVGEERRLLKPGQGTVVPAGIRHTLTTGPGARLIEVWYPMPADRQKRTDVQPCRGSGSGVRTESRRTPPSRPLNVSQFWTYDPKAYLSKPVYSREYPPCVNCQ